MADFKFQCSFCGQTLEAKSEWAGERTECPNCHKQFDIPNTPLPKIRPVKAVVEKSPVFSRPVCGGIDFRSTERFFRAYIWTFAAWAALNIICTVFSDIFGDAETPDQDTAFGLLFISVMHWMAFCACYVVSTVFQYILLYRYWTLIPNQQTPPLKRVLFLLIPVFSWYWGFRAYAELGRRQEELNRTGSCAPAFGMIFAIVRTLELPTVLLGYIPVIGSVFVYAYAVMEAASEAAAMIAFHREARRMIR